MTVTALHPGRMKAAARGDLTEQAVDDAQELAFLVRDEGRDAITAWLDSHGIPGDVPTRALLITLAAMVSIDATPEQMLAWVTWDEFGCPLPGAVPASSAPAPLAVPGRFYEDCGTPAAYWRHKRAGHPQAQIEPCGCGQACRDMRNARYAARRNGQVAPVSRKSAMEIKFAEYTRLRRDGVKKADAAARLEVSLRTAERYEARLKTQAGQERDVAA